MRVVVANAPDDDVVIVIANVSDEFRFSRTNANGKHHYDGVEVVSTAAAVAKSITNRYYSPVGKRKGKQYYVIFYTFYFVPAATYIK